VVYYNELRSVPDPAPILSDYPEFVEPLDCERRMLAPPVVCESGGELRVRSWRYWYNARGIVEMENRLEAKATAVVDVHPWGIDDAHGLRTPEPAGCAFFCTKEKNGVCLDHIREVLNPFFRKLRGYVALVGHSLPGTEDEIRKLLYASVDTPPEALDRDEGERRLAELLGEHSFEGDALVRQMELQGEATVHSYFGQALSTDAGDRYNGPGFWELPMPISSAMEVPPEDLVFYDGEGYPKVRDFLRERGVRHVLLTGYATDMCVARTTCGYENLSKDFNLFLVGDATMATFPGSTTPKHATQVALANAALSQMVTQASWVRIDEA